MTDFSWLANNLATLALVVATIVLAYMTYTLTRATTNLGEIQIRPSLFVANKQGISRYEDRRLRFTVQGSGAQAARITKVTAKRVDGSVLEVRPETAGQPMLSHGERFTWDVFGPLGRDEEVILTIEYEDIDGNIMKPWKSTLVAGWLGFIGLPSNRSVSASLFETTRTELDVEGLDVSRLPSFVITR